MMFSILIPSFQRPIQILACLRSIAKVNYLAGEFEVIVIDDGSEPPLAEHIAMDEFRYSLKLLRQKNAGPGAARNEGASQAKGRWLAFCDDDCLPSQEWLKGLQSALEAAPEALVGGFTLNGCGDNIFAVANQLLIDSVCDWFSKFAPELLFYPSNNFACDRLLFLRLGGFDSNFSLAAGEDREFCARWMASGGKLLRQTEAVLHHRHPQTLGKFTEMHFRYGRGAALLHSITPISTMQRTRVYLYIRLLTDPLRKLPVQRALLAIPLLAWSQWISALGYAYQHFVRRSSSSKSRSRSRT